MVCEKSHHCFAHSVVNCAAHRNMLIWLCIGMYSDEDGEFDDSEDDDSKVQEEEDEWESDSDDAAVPPQKCVAVN